MKKVIVALWCVLSVCAYALTLQEELVIVNRLVIRMQCTPEWEDNLTLRKTGRVLTPRFVRYEDLFRDGCPSNRVGGSWTAEECRTAFENFVNDIPVLSTNGTCKGIEGLGGLALGYCHRFGQTNVLGAALRILAAKHSVAQSTATSVFADFAVPSDEINAFAANMLTNETAMTALTRHYFLTAYVGVLKKHRTECPPICFTNGVSLVMSALNGWDGAIQVDRLLLEGYPEYELSSNRLAIATAALNDRRPRADYWVTPVHNYFTPITNRLMNAPQPLPEVEELRHLVR